MSTHRASRHQARQHPGDRDRDPDRSSSTISHIKLSDFGLARHVVESESLMVTQADAVVGTPAYMAPEQGTGGAIDARTDVYAMGATLFHCWPAVRRSSPPA